MDCRVWCGEELAQWPDWPAKIQWGLEISPLIPRGMIDLACVWIVKLDTGVWMENIVPFNHGSVAVRWVIDLNVGTLWVVEPLRTPEEWPGMALNAPEESQEEPMPLLDNLESPPAPASAQEFNDGIALAGPSKPISGPDASIDPACEL